MKRKRTNKNVQVAVAETAIAIVCAAAIFVVPEIVGRASDTTVSEPIATSIRRITVTRDEPVVTSPKMYETPTGWSVNELKAAMMWEAYYDNEETVEVDTFETDNADIIGEIAKVYSGE